ncbi:hypothetical protein IQ07DRAFT_149015 [Pyrenochaeta sp. DS3sAY3a]|nr:hypothetical protein IQ07DRAFT_149015 [Pyrenochaeta sp. DS3sAY3a]
MPPTRSALEVQALEHFDRLVDNGELFWTNVQPRYVPSMPFGFQFRVANSLRTKPMTATQKKVENAFADANPDFTLNTIDHKHKLILNKYSVVRPQFVLPTLEFEPQSTPLDRSDIYAISDTLARLDGDYMAIFNCGADAGASVGHKHMQIIPKPADEDFSLFPDNADLKDEIWVHPDVPYHHAIQRLPSLLDSDHVLHVYQALRSYLAVDDSTPHNMIMVKEWMMIVPRQKARIGKAAANAAAMVGIVWVTNEEEYQAWTESDPMKLLASFGIPKDISSKSNRQQFDT